MKKILLMSFIIQAYCVYSQTGPGGVGTTDGTSNLELWLDASKITGLSDGANVTSWADASGNGLTAVSSGMAAEEPIFVTNSVNTSLPSISFDGVDDFLNLGTPASLNLIPGTDSWSFFIVYNVPNPLEKGTFFAKATSTGGTRQYQYTMDDSGGTIRFTSFIGGLSVTGSITSTGAWFVSSHTNNTTNRDSWTNEGDNFANPTIGAGQVQTAEVLIGARRSTPTTGTGFLLEGSIAEIAMYDVEATAAQRIIVTNYLAAKYDITLSANDVYDMDDNANGDFDFEMAGIGQASDGSNHLDAQGTGIVRILNPTGLGNDEFLMWGHDNGVEIATEATDVPAGVDVRFDRVWRVSEANSSGSAVDVGNIDIRWDLTAKGPVTASDLRLLIDTDNDGTFADETPISGATFVSGNVYEFSGVSAIADNLRFTLGTTNFLQTPLPIELISFNAKPIDNRVVQLDWTTASEINNDYFTIEKSKDIIDWKEVKNVDGAGNSTLLISYTAVDENPYHGISYYRLKQTDFDGQYSYSKIRVVNINDLESSQINIYPNPTNAQITIEGRKSEIAEFRIYKMDGQDVSSLIKVVESKDFMLTIDMSNLPNGIYIVKTKTTINKVYKQ